MSSVSLKTWVAFPLPFDAVVVVMVVVDDLRRSGVIAFPYIEEHLPFTAAVHGVIAVSAVPAHNETIPPAITHSAEFLAQSKSTYRLSSLRCLFDGLNSSASNLHARSQELTSGVVCPYHGLLYRVLRAAGPFQVRLIAVSSRASPAPVDHLLVHLQ